jgi:outer membrane protein OmpA-like peptidoglycan-associated protein
MRTATSWRRAGRAVRSWTVVGALALAAAAPAHAQSDPAPQSVEELKAALADLRRRLAEQQAGGAGSSADAKLRTAQQQIERLVASIGALRRERDSLRAELGAARTELAARPQASLDAERRLAQARAEIARLRQQIRLAAPALPPMLMPLSSPEPTTVREVLDGWDFAPGSAELTEAASPRLEAIAATARAQPAARVRIVGYADDRGLDAGNRRLSLARAEAVRDRLLELLPPGFGPIVVEGRGEPDPVAGNETLDGGTVNRRVVVTIEP